jgi:phospholipase C
MGYCPKLRGSLLVLLPALLLAGCQGLKPLPANSGNGSLSSVNHIVFLVQENRSFDNYFGAMREYWANPANGFHDQPFDGLPQFPSSSPSGAKPTNPTCDNSGSGGPYANCPVDANSQQIPSFHMNSMCVENPSPSWNESHEIWNLLDPISSTATLDGAVATAAHDSKNEGFIDTIGQRVMGYYDGIDLNYYYFMASSFATSDRWFSPVMTRTDPNREFLIAGTSGGYAYPNGTNTQDTPVITSPIIFEKLQNAGITWKIYVHPDATGCTTAQCLYNQSYIQGFSYGQTILKTYPQNLVPVSQFITDAQNGTLPQVAQIEPASAVGLDEHPADSDVNPPCCSVQAGAAYVKTLIDTVMGTPSSPSPSWKDSVFILTYDEFGGFYDHVPPQKLSSPGDFSTPIDLMPGDVCTSQSGPNCQFDYTGYRVPMIVISPFTKKNFVSHTVADNTAILKLIEKRFLNGASLTNRDGGQIDMTEFFDFTNMPWKTPPAPPAQNTGGACYLDHLP